MIVLKAFATASFLRLERVNTTLGRSLDVDELKVCQPDRRTRARIQGMATLSSADIEGNTNARRTASSSCLMFGDLELANRSS